MSFKQNRIDRKKRKWTKSIDTQIPSQYGIVFSRASFIKATILSLRKATKKTQVLKDNMLSGFSLIDPTIL